MHCLAVRSYAGLLLLLEGRRIQTANVRRSSYQSGSDLSTPAFPQPSRHHTASRRHHVKRKQFPVSELGESTDRTETAHLRTIGGCPTTIVRYGRRNDCPPRNQQARTNTQPVLISSYSPAKSSHLPWVVLRAELCSVSGPIIYSPSNFGGSASPLYSIISILLSAGAYSTSSAPAACILQHATKQIIKSNTCFRSAFVKCRTNAAIPASNVLLISP